MHFLKKIILMIAATVTLFAISNKTSLALEFKTKDEKIAWIKNAVKGKTFKPNYKEDDEYYPNGYYTPEEKQFMREFLTDFLAQTNIEYVEPIATGNSITDPAIAKFNTSCPKKKPMNVGFRTFFNIDPYKITDEILESALKNKNKIMSLPTCTRNFKVFKLNIFNTSNNEQEYILYCDTVTSTGINEYRQLVREDVNESMSPYLHIHPNRCLYSRELIWVGAMENNIVTSIIKYRGLYYILNIALYPKITRISIARWRKDMEWHRFYHYRTGNSE